MQSDGDRERLSRIKAAVSTSSLGVVFQSPFGKLVRSWTFQGMLYMPRGEFLVRFWLEIVIILGIWRATGDPRTGTGAVTAVGVHTLFWLGNSHFWALEIVPGRRLVRNTPGRVQKYLSALRRRVAAARCIDAVFASGSLARGAFGQWSDLDVVFVPGPRWRDRLCTYLLAARERLYAAVARIPLELYCYDLAAMESINAEESRLVLKAPDTDTAGAADRWIAWDDFWRAPSPFFQTHSSSARE